MTQTYAQVTRQIAALQSKAEQLKKREIDGVIERIKEAIDAYGLTAEQLFGGRSKPGRTAAAGKRVAKQRYADGAGNVWGGMGPRPLWLRAALEQGKSLEEFAVSGSNESSAGEQRSARTSPAKKKQARRGAKRGKRRTARQAYSNGTDTWSGFGRQPRWLQAALADGAKLDDLKVAAKD